MFISNTGHSIPALELRINWSAYMVNSVVDVTRVVAAAQSLAEKVVKSSLSTYAGFTRGTITSDDSGLVLIVSEPYTLETVLLSPSTGTRYPVATTLFLAPAGKVNKQVQVDGFNKTWFETVLHRYVSVTISVAITEALAGTKNGKIYAQRLTGMRAQQRSLSDRLLVAYAPVGLYERGSEGLVLATPGYVWADASARVIMDHATATNAVVNTVTASFAEGADQISAMVRPKIAEICQNLAMAVNLDKATSLTLNDVQKSNLENLAASFVGMPLLALDIIGVNTRTMDMEALTKGMTALASLLAAQEQTANVIDIDASPRSLAEMIYMTSGQGNFRFLDSIDAFYRRKEFPELPLTVPPALAQVILTVHPALVSNAVIVNDRTVRYSDANGSHEVTFPDRLGTGYTFTSPEGADRARADLEKLNAFIQTAFTYLTGDKGLAPLVLRQLGIRGIQKGASFALNA